MPNQSHQAESVRDPPEDTMDVVYLLIALAFFALTWGFIKLCEGV